MNKIILFISLLLLFPSSFAENIEELPAEYDKILWDQGYFTPLRKRGYYPVVVEAIRKNEPFFSRSQHALFVENIGVDETKIIGGFCMGLTTLWLYSKWLQFTYPEKTYGYNNDWFNEITKFISTVKSQIEAYNSSSNLSKLLRTLSRFTKILFSRQSLNTNVHDMQKFVKLVLFFSGYYTLDKFSQYDLETLMPLSMLDNNGKILKKKYSIASIFHPNDLKELLKKIVYDDELVYLVYINKHNIKHAAGIFKHGNNYSFYDPSCRLGEYKSTSIEKIAEVIDSYALKMPGDGIAIGIMVFNFGDNSHQYPEQRDFIIKTNREFDIESALIAGGMSVYIDCLESLKFFLDQGIESHITTYNKHLVYLCSYSLFDFAVSYKKEGILQEILNRGIDPNQKFKHEELHSGSIVRFYTRALPLAARKGHLEIVKILLVDPRINICLTGGPEGKTALMYAEKNGHDEIVDLLRSYKINCFQETETIYWDEYREDKCYAEVT